MALLSVSCLSIKLKAPKGIGLHTVVLKQVVSRSDRITFNYKTLIYMF